MGGSGSRSARAASSWAYRLSLAACLRRRLYDLPLHRLPLHRSGQDRLRRRAASAVSILAIVDTSCPHPYKGVNLCEPEDIWKESHGIHGESKSETGFFMTWKISKRGRVSDDLGPALHARLF